MLVLSSFGLRTFEAKTAITVIVDNIARISNGINSGIIFASDTFNGISA